MRPTLQSWSRNAHDIKHPTVSLSIATHSTSISYKINKFEIKYPTKYCTEVANRFSQYLEAFGNSIK